jgi:hypothetical protein
MRAITGVYKHARQEDELSLPLLVDDMIAAINI